MVLNFLKKLFTIQVKWEIVQLEDNSFYLKVYLPKSVIPKEIPVPKVGRIHSSFLLQQSKRVHKLMNTVLENVYKQTDFYKTSEYKNVEFAHLDINDNNLIVYGKLKK